MRECESPLHSGPSAAEDPPGEPPAAVPLSLLRSLGQALLGASSLNEAVEALLGACRELLGAREGYLLLAEESAPLPAFFPTLAGERLAQCSRHGGQSALLSLLRERGKPFWENDFARSNLAALLPPDHPQLQNLLVVPLPGPEGPLGAIVLANKPGGFSEADAQLVAALGSLAAPTLVREQALAGAQKGLESFASFFDRLGLAVLLHELPAEGSPGQFLEANEAAARLLAEGREQILQRTPGEYSLYPPGKLAELRAAGAASWEGELVNATGKPIPISAHVQRIPGPQRALALAMLDDISAARGLERLLRQYERAIGASGDLIAAIDRSGRVTLANAALLHLARRGREEVLGRPFAQLIRPEVLTPAVWQALEACLQGQRQQLELELRPAREGVRHYFVSLYPMADGQGTVDGVLAVARDVTLERLLREEQQLSLSFLRALADAQDTEAVLELALGLLRAHTGCEAGAIRLREGEDYPYRASYGLTGEFLELDGALLGGDGRYACLCGAVLGDGSGSCGLLLPSGGFWTSDLMALQNERGELPVANWRPWCLAAGFRSLLLLPLRANGRVLGLLQLADRRPGLFSAEQVASLERLCADIALGLVAKQAAEELAKSEQRFRQLYQDAPIPYQSLDAQGRLVAVNRAWAELLGVSPAQALGQEFASFLAPESAAAFAQSLEEALAGRDVQGELVLVKADGGKAIVLLRGHPVSDPVSAQWRLHCTLTDFTLQRKLEEELRQLQRMESVGRLAGGVAHDFNNILTALVGHATFAMELLPAEHDARAELEEVMAACERAARLTRQLLTFSRRHVAQRRLLDLRELVSSLGKMLRRLLGEDIELVLLPSAEPCTIFGDEAQLEQVIVNLAVNARDAMPGGGTLTIEVGPVALDEAYARTHLGVTAGQYVLLAVSDTGVGMSEEVKQHLFEPFFTTKEPGKGTGLGLSIVYGVVRQHGGHIRVYSELGCGSTFKIYVPFAAAGDLAAEPEASEPFPRGTETLLVVEDDASVRAVTARILEQLGYRVLVAGTPREALAIGSAHPGRIDLLVSDVVMPGMNGRQLAQLLQESHPEMATLYTSGYTDNAIVRLGVLDEGVAFLQKPFTASALAQKVRQVLDARQRA